VGEAYVGVRFETTPQQQQPLGTAAEASGGGGGRGRSDTVLAAAVVNETLMLDDPDGRGELFGLTAVERMLFSMYDADEDGLLSPHEFTTLVHDMRQVYA